MGVTGLWTVVQPCARPIKLETLNRKRLAVDASIWIYQFLKAVRDKEGNALRNSHVVGFFRRICKLLFIGIQPVFVFDGGAPALKRQTISARKSRREGRKEDAVRTAGKLLALQMQRAAEEEEDRRRREARERADEDEEEAVPDNAVYADELMMTPQERQQNRKFKKKDQYHLPEMDSSFAAMGQPNDPRIMSIEELEAYARQFDTGEDINVYDFSKIDFDSPFFTSLPASDRYNILNAARLRSRLRMGYSKEQLESMFPDQMAFSKFQVDRVRERNELTQRLMNINGMNDDAMFGVGGSGRVSGEKGREYVLVKNDGVEGGWALGVVNSKDEGQEDKPIDVDELATEIKQEDVDEDMEEEDDFEDIPIEGLNRLPKLDQTARRNGAPSNDVVKKRRALYASRKKQSRGTRHQPRQTAREDSDSLFVADEPEVPDEGDVASDDEEELQRAIAMSMQPDGEGDGDLHLDPDSTSQRPDVQEEDYLSSFRQKRAEEARPIPKGSAKVISHTINQRAAKSAPKTLFEESDSDNEPDSQPARQAQAVPSVRQPPPQQIPSQAAPLAEKNKPKVSSGPLPFEKLDPGSSILGKKKMQEAKERTKGGFEKESDKKKDDSQPLPPWFAGNLDEDMAAQNKIEREDRQKAREYEDTQKFEFAEPSVLRRGETNEVIDLDAPEELKSQTEVIDLENTQDEPGKNGMQIEGTDTTAKIFVESNEPEKDESQPTMGGMADAVTAVPQEVNPPKASPEPAFEERLSPQRRTSSDSSVKVSKPVIARPNEVDEEAGSELNWSESEHENEVAAKDHAKAPIEDKTSAAPPKSPSPDFEDVNIPDQPDTSRDEIKAREKEVEQEIATMNHVSGAADQNAPVDNEADEYGYYSDSEDDELMKQLATEAEEHARFASELNHKTQQQNIKDYENELKQLRSQQKKDRRDADEVTQIMITECQQLLKMFGLPYITAPMEAEAQCAELVHLGLVDGIVTDDSDCFLFGGTRIYKNMFNQAKFVECYLASDLEKEFDLTRQKLIGVAQLLGSDYTEGLVGVGPVTALEMLSEFPNLNDFKDWYTKVQMNQITKAEDQGHPFRKKFRRNAAKIFLPASFPDPRVEMAYLEPEVDSDPSEFQWGVPDLDSLRSFLMATIGWTQERTDEVLVPVIKDMNRRANEGTQSNITKFFSGSAGMGSYAPRVRMDQGSKRMGTALSRMADKAKRKRKGAGEPVMEDVPPEIEAAEAETQPDEQEATAPARKRKATTRMKAKLTAGTDEDADEDDECQDPSSRKTTTRRKKQKK